MTPSRYRFLVVAASAALVLNSIPLPLHAADAGQEAVLREGSSEWNEMRKLNPSEQIDLAGAKLNGRRLREVDFSRASLVGADLRQSDFGGSDFRGADLHGAMLDEAYLGGSRMAGADLSGVSFERASAAEADFSRTKMPSSVLRRSELTGARFAGADLRGADLRESRMEHADLSHADLRAANFWLASTSGVNFNGALISDETVLPNGKPGSAKWAAEHGAVFMPVSKPVAAPNKAATPSFAASSKEMAGSSATAPASMPLAGKPAPQGMSPAQPLAATLKPLRAWRPDPKSIAYDADQYEQLKSNVTKWNRMRKEQPNLKVILREAPLSSRVLAYADLHEADLEKASFKRTDLDEANFRGANLRNADLRSANLEEADFREADLRGANLWLANTSETQFDGAFVSAETVLDNGKKASKSWADEHGTRFAEK
ncbi:MAG TPA: pentapeptide repeat-containing protein [Chlorobaculum parvum]|uniref:Pentapeptide repeat-containing protein n=1 Tax=Chlorobaculum parvum TaxID=274539 RepID=A0A7C5DE33_9CHLB|nr:pentapeptide repeat-containing protein [Chlorobaculum parvum]